MIDIDGYRANVGIIICNDDCQVLWAKRLKQEAWQFPQGGVDANETPEQAMYRELWEETGLETSHVSLIKEADTWYRYKLPKRMIRNHTSPVCIGQKQKWFLLHLKTHAENINLDATKTPEFEHWKWVDYELPQTQVVHFKKRVYQCAMRELKQFLPVSLKG